jgi:hypothetical protein
MVSLYQLPFCAADDSALYVDSRSGVVNPARPTFLRDGSVPGRRRGSIDYLGNFFCRAVDPIDSEAGMFQKPFSFSVREPVPHGLQYPIIDAIFAEMPESLYDKRGFAVAAGASYE